MSHFYFAYGSNMNPARMHARGLVWDQVGGGQLADAVLAFDKRGGADAPGHACFHYRRGETLFGVLYRLSSAQQISLLDQFERTPINYSRELFAIRANGAVVWAWTYVANPAVIHAGGLPEAEYLAHLMAGAPWLPAEHVSRLRRQRCANE